MLILKEEKANIKTYDVLGMIVTHKKWGEGLATECDGKRITIEFDVGEKIFQIPQAFEKGYLTSEYPEFLEAILKKAAIDEKIESLDSVIKEKQDILETLII